MNKWEDYMCKEESIQEFMARGGKITKIPPKEKEENKHIVRPSIAGPPKLFSIGEAENMFGEIKKIKKKKKKKAVDLGKVDESVIPSSLQHILKDLYSE